MLAHRTHRQTIGPAQTSLCAGLRTVGAEDGGRHYDAGTIHKTTVRRTPASNSAWARC